jgi:hypothetical protein
MNTALNLVILKFSSHSWSVPTKSLPNRPQLVTISEQAASHVFLVEAIYPNQFITRRVTAFQCDRMSRNLQMFGEKANQRCVRFSFHGWRAQFDLNRVTVNAYDTVTPGIGNGVNPQNCHSAIISEGGKLARRILSPHAMIL